MLDNLKRDDAIEDDGDSLGGSFGPLDSGIYKFAIDMAYLDKSSGGAMSLNLALKTADGKSLKTTIYITSGDTKGNRNYFMVKKAGQETGERRYLPGFVVGNNIALLAIGKELSELTPEEKTINVYDFTQKKDVPKQKQVLMDLLGAEIDLGVMKQVVDKNAKNDATGNYEPTGETREENEVVKAFRSRDGLTVAEITAGVTESVFLQQWVDKNAGQVRDKTSGKKGASGTTGAPTASAAPAAGGTTGSIFS